MAKQQLRIYRDQDEWVLTAARQGEGREREVSINGHLGLFRVKAMLSNWIVVMMVQLCKFTESLSCTFHTSTFYCM